MPVNPVLRRELAERWRGKRTFVVLTVYVAALALAMQLMWWAGRSFLRFMSVEGFAAGPSLGRFMFENLLSFVLLLVLFITPGYAAAQISGERERRSLPLLQLTLLRPVQIVAGKLGASVAWLLLLVVAALPFGAAAFFLGGVSVSDLLRSAAYVVVVTVAIAGMGLGVSSLTRRTTASIVLTYALVLFLVMGTGFVAIVEAVVRSDSGRFERPVSLYLNPYYGLADAANARDFTFGPQMPSVLTPFAQALPGEDVFADPGPVPEDVLVREGFVQEPGGAFGPRRGRAVWLIEAAIYALLGGLGLALATRRVRAGRVTARLRRDQLPRTAQAPPPPPGASPPPPDAPVP